MENRIIQTVGRIVEEVNQNVAGMIQEMNLEDQQSVHMGHQTELLRQLNNKNFSRNLYHNKTQSPGRYSGVGVHLH